MTIAVCYVSPEGVVLGADSTSTYGVGGNSLHYYNHAQKLFEIGENATLGLVTWGLGSLQISSYRTLIARLADDLAATPPVTVEEACQRWIDLFWSAYSDPNGDIGRVITFVQTQSARRPYVEGAASAPDMRTKDEETLFQHFKLALVAGFCIGGYMLPDRAPAAYEIIFDPLAAKPVPVSKWGYWFWGAPNMIQRLINGCDDGLKDSIQASGKWTGTREELDLLTSQYTLAHPIVPIRDAIDFVHTCIESTIKAFKFSNMAQICGGPIEIAVITTDRRFRWVRHKRWDTAITDGETYNGDDTH